MLREFSDGGALKKRLFCLLSLCFNVVVAAGPAGAEQHRLFCDSILIGPTRSVVALPPSSDQRWRVVVSEIGDGGPNFSRADSFAEFINGLNSSQKEAWLSTLISHYRRLPKFAAHGTPAFQPGARRLLDRVLSLTARGDLKILQSLEDGLSPRAAYGRYLGEMAKAFQSPFRAEDIDLILSVLQNYVREEATMGDRGSLVVGGSLIDGRATLTESDLDLGIRGDPSDHHLRGLVQKEIDHVLRTNLPGAKLPVEVHRFSEKDYGRLHPVVFVINADHIEMLIYPPAQEAKNIWALEPSEPKRFIYE